MGNAASRQRRIIDDTSSTELTTLTTAGAAMTGSAGDMNGGGDERFLFHAESGHDTLKDFGQGFEIDTIVLWSWLEPRNKGRFRLRRGISRWSAKRTAACSVRDPCQKHVTGQGSAARCSLGRPSARDNRIDGSTALSVGALATTGQRTPLQCSAMPARVVRASSSSHPLNAWIAASSDRLR